MPAYHAKACMYSPSAINSTENPRQARMQVRQPPHQSMGPYLLPEVARCTATDVVAILCSPFYFSFLKAFVLAFLARRDPGPGSRALNVGLSYPRWQENCATFDATGV